MDSKLRRPTKRSLASIAVAAAFAIALPVGATGPADRPMEEMIVAQAATPAPMKPAKSTAPTTTAKGSQSDRVESRISEMHTKLKITQAQEGQWNNVAQVMRDNAKTLDTLTQARISNANTMTAIADLKSYSEITDAHAEGLKKFVAAFQPLYDSMSDVQKKAADMLFQGHHGGGSQTASKTHS
jgi:LTXXQ motif family protein